LAAHRSARSKTSETGRLGFLAYWAKGGPTGGAYHFSPPSLTRLWILGSGASAHRCHWQAGPMGQSLHSLLCLLSSGAAVRVRRRYRRRRHGTEQELWRGQVGTKGGLHAVDSGLPGLRRWAPGAAAAWLRQAGGGPVKARRGQGLAGAKRRCIKVVDGILVTRRCRGRSWPTHSEEVAR
jgi:hypothetical protein